MPAPIKRKKQRGPRSGFGCLTWVGSRQRWGVQQQFRQPNGKTTRRIVHWFEREESATREQAQAAFAKCLERAKVEGLSYTKGQALDIATLCAEFAEKGQELFRRGDKVSSAWDFVKASADQWANMQGKLRIADYSGQDFRAFRDALDRLASSGAYRALQTREGVNRRLQKCIRIARWGVSMGLCPPSFPQVLDSVEYLQTGNAKAKESEARMPCSIRARLARFGLRTIGAVAAGGASQDEDVEVAKAALAALGLLGLPRVRRSPALLAAGPVPPLEEPVLEAVADEPAAASSAPAE